MASPRPSPPLLEKAGCCFPLSPKGQAQLWDSAAPPPPAPKWQVWLQDSAALPPGPPPPLALLPADGQQRWVGHSRSSGCWGGYEGAGGWLPMEGQFMMGCHPPHLSLLWKLHLWVPCLAVLSLQIGGLLAGGQAHSPPHVMAGLLMPFQATQPVGCLTAPFWVPTEQHCPVLCPRAAHLTRSHGATVGPSKHMGPAPAHGDCR